MQTAGASHIIHEVAGLVCFYGYARIGAHECSHIYWCKLGVLASDVYACSLELDIKFSALIYSTKGTHVTVEYLALSNKAQIWNVQLIGQYHSDYFPTGWLIINVQYECRMRFVL